MKRIGLLEEDIDHIDDLTSPPENDMMDKILCPICGKEYKSLSGLKAHLKKEHPDAVVVDEAEKTEE